MKKLKEIAKMKKKVEEIKKIKDKIKKMKLASQSYQKEVEVYQKEIETSLDRIRNLKVILEEEMSKGIEAEKAIQTQLEEMKKMGFVNQDQLDPEEIKAYLEDERGHKKPRSMEIEKAVLNILFFNNELIDKLLSKPKFEKVFYGEAHRMIYNEMCSLRKKKLPIDLVTLSDYLTQASFQYLLRTTETKNYLKNLFLGSSTDKIRNEYRPENLDAYIKILEDKALLRYIIWVGDEITKAARREDWKRILSLGRTFQRITKGKRLEKLRKKSRSKE